MEAQPKNKISIEKATALINQGLPLTDAYVDGNIKIIICGSWDKEVIINNCVIENFEGSVTQFKKPVKFTNTHFRNCTFVFTYFIKGLIINNCTFGKHLDFQSGGHNKAGHSIIIQNNRFSGFVNFFDCRYTGEVSVCNNNFSKGTNIKSKNQLITFDITPLIFDNIGQTDIEAEWHTDK